MPNNNQPEDLYIHVLLLAADIFIRTPQFHEVNVTREVEWSMYSKHRYSVIVVFVWVAGSTSVVCLLFTRFIICKCLIFMSENSLLANVCIALYPTWNKFLLTYFSPHFSTLAFFHLEKCTIELSSVHFDIILTFSNVTALKVSLKNPVQRQRWKMINY